MRLSLISPAKSQKVRQNNLTISYTFWQQQNPKSQIKVKRGVKIGNKPIMKSGTKVKFQNILLSKYVSAILLENMLFTKILESYHQLGVQVFDLYFASIIFICQQFQAMYLNIPNVILYPTYTILCPRTDLQIL